jgi:hypothetical protein
MEKFSTSVIIEEMKVQTSVTYYFTPTRIITMILIFNMKTRVGKDKKRLELYVATFQTGFFHLANCM